MSHAKIVIDGITRLDTDLALGYKRPPKELVDLMDPNTNPEPYLKPVGVALACAVTENNPITITIETSPTGWTMDVRRWVS